mmetsp:Transcript_12419/g.40920  ORF Transcript_12419/g.40920 Transcript_12419/m.40920 type:complete len:207 (-) Transcript_12419:2330-2950(-)
MANCAIAALLRSSCCFAATSAAPSASSASSAPPPPPAPSSAPAKASAALRFADAADGSSRPTRSSAMPRRCVLSLRTSLLKRASTCVVGRSSEAVTASTSLCCSPSPSRMAACTYEMLTGRRRVKKACASAGTRSWMRWWSTRFEAYFCRRARSYAESSLPSERRIGESVASAVVVSWSEKVSFGSRMERASAGRASRNAIPSNTM